MTALKSPLLTNNLRWVLFAMILANIASAMVFTMLSVYLRELGASVAQVGLVYSLAALVPLALQILGGWLSDTIGRLRTIAIGSLAATFGYLGFWLAPSWGWVLAALCLEYISGSLVGPSFGAYIAEQSSEEQRGRVFGVTRGIFLVVAVVGPWLGGVLSQYFGFKTMFLVAFGLYTCASILRIWMATTLRFTSGRMTETPTLGSLRGKLGTLGAMILSGGVLTWIFVTDGVRDIAYNLSDQLRPLFLSQVGVMNVEQIGQLGAVLGAAMMLITFPAGWLSDRFGERRLIAGGFFIEAVGIILMLVFPSFAGFTASALVFGAGIGVMGPAYDALVSKVVPDNLRGTAFGFFWTSIGVLSLAAPWVGGQLWERLGPGAPFMFTAGVVLLSALPAWFRFKLQPDTMGAAKET